MSVPFFVVITGPTGVGKTAFVDALAQKLPVPIEILNADTGQLYTPLSIGTAKPDLDQVTIPHHLFNVVSEPRDYTAQQYREAVIGVMHDVIARGAVPVLVGGSGFYIASLFYPPHEQLKESGRYDFSQKSTHELWELLASIDEKRAAALYKNDRYRIIRALRIWYETGARPSTLVPTFAPPGVGAVYFLTRERQELHERINDRVRVMLEQGWLDEVAGLPPEWHEYLLQKKLIGYPEIIRYLNESELGVLPEDAYDLLRDKIAQKTRGYAKRQVTFWRGLERRLKKSDPEARYIRQIGEINLTLSSYDLYIKQLSEEVASLYSSVGHGA